MAADDETWAAREEDAPEDVAEAKGDLARGSELGAGAWSYFGDPRAIAHNGHTFSAYKGSLSGERKVTEHADGAGSVEDLSKKRAS